MTNGYYANSIRDYLLRLGQTPNRVYEHSDNVEHDLNDSLRQLSRTRIALSLRQLRAANGFTYAQVQTDTGLTQQALFDVEFGDRRLSIMELSLLVTCYKVTLSDILGVDIEL